MWSHLFAKRRVYKQRTQQRRSRQHDNNAVRRTESSENLTFAGAASRTPDNAIPFVHFANVRERSRDVNATSGSWRNRFGRSVCVTKRHVATRNNGSCPHGESETMFEIRTARRTRLSRLSENHSTIDAATIMYEHVPSAVRALLSRHVSRHTAATRLCAPRAHSTPKDFWLGARVFDGVSCSCLSLGEHFRAMCDGIQAML